MYINCSKNFHYSASSLSARTSALVTTRWGYFKHRGQIPTPRQRDQFRREINTEKQLKNLSTVCLNWNHFYYITLKFKECEIYTQFVWRWEYILVLQKDILFKNLLSSWNSPINNALISNSKNKESSDCSN